MFEADLDFQEQNWGGRIRVFRIRPIAGPRIEADGSLIVNAKALMGAKSSHGHLEAVRNKSSRMVDQSRRGRRNEVE